QGIHPVQPSIQKGLTTASLDRAAVSCVDAGALPSPGGISGHETIMVDKPPPDPEFEALLRHIQESRGLDFRGYKRTSLRRRITLRMEAVGVEDFASYQAHLEVHPGEFGDLLNTVLINVTSFFRDE